LIAEHLAGRVCLDLTSTAVITRFGTPAQVDAWCEKKWRRGSRRRPDDDLRLYLACSENVAR
jgi:hypothetical protein